MNMSQEAVLENEPPAGINLGTKEQEMARLKEILSKM